MEHHKPRVDQQTLAAFLARTLPDEDRSDVVAYLVAHPDARELVCMAAAALAEASTPTSP